MENRCFGLQFITHTKGFVNIVVPEQISEENVVLYEWMSGGTVFTQVPGDNGFYRFTGNTQLKGNTKKNPWGFVRNKSALYRFVAVNNEHIVVGCSNIFCVYGSEGDGNHVSDDTLRRHYALFEEYKGKLISMFDSFWKSPLLFPGATRWVRLCRVFVCSKKKYPLSKQKCFTFESSPNMQFGGNWQMQMVGGSTRGRRVWVGL
jgi:hypothetical protein